MLRPVFGIVLSIISFLALSACPFSCPSQKQEVSKPIQQQENSVSEPKKPESKPGVELFRGINSGDLKLIDQAIANGADLAGNAQTHSALHEAVAAKKLQVVEHLLSNYRSEIDIEARDSRGLTAFLIACIDLENEIAQKLLHYGADIKARDMDGNLAIHIWAQQGQTEIIRTVFKEKPSLINEKNKNSENALYKAAENGHVATIDVLLSLGADIEAKGPFGETALFAAARHDHDEAIAKLVVKNANLYALNDDKDMPIHIAARSGSVEAIREIAKVRIITSSTRSGMSSKTTKKAFDLNTKGQNGEPALFVAVRTGKQEVITELKKLGVDVSLENDQKVDVVYVAAKAKQEASMKALKESFGIDINHKYAGGKTRMHYAVHNDDVDAIAGLHFFGANVNEGNDAGETPLFLAVRTTKLKSIGALKKAGAKVNVVNSEGLNAIYVAAQLEDRNVMAALEAFDNFGGLDELLWLAASRGDLSATRGLIHAGANAKGLNANGQSAMHIAAGAGHWRIIEQLLKANALIDGIDNNGETPLFFAARAGKDQVVSRLIGYKNEGFLCPVLDETLNGKNATVLSNMYIKKPSEMVFTGANPHLLNHDGVTVLYVAARAGQTKVVDQLLALGINIDERVDGLRNSLHLAAEKGHLKTFKNLVKSGANIDLENADGLSSLFIAAGNERANIVRHLFETGFDAKFKSKMGTAFDSGHANYGTQMMHYAAATANVAAIHALSKRGVSVDVVDEMGNTPFHRAAASNQVLVMEAFLKMDGALLDKTNTNGESALFMAIRHESEDAIVALRRFGAKIFINRSGQSPLYVAARSVAEAKNQIRVLKRKKVAKLLAKEFSLDVNAKVDVEQNTLMHFAAKTGDENALRGLKHLGADLDALNNEGESALFAAVRAGQKGAIGVLAELGAKSDLLNKKNDHVMYVAALSGKRDSIEALEAHFGMNVNADFSGRTLLHVAASRGDTLAMNGLLQGGADIEAKGSAGETPIFTALRANHTDMVKALFDAGAKLTAANPAGETPTFVLARTMGGTLAQHGIPDMSLWKMLKDECGIDINARESGKSLMQQAAMRDDILALMGLIHMGAHVNHADKDGETPIFYALRYRQMNAFNYLRLNPQVDMKVKNGKEQSLWTVAAQIASNDKNTYKNLLHQLMAEKIVDQNTIDTELHAACFRNDVASIHGLVAAGANVEARNEDGETPIFIAVRTGFTENIKALHENGADLNARNSKGQTPLYLAASRGIGDPINALKEKGVDANRQFDGSTMLHLAAKNNDSTTVSNLIELAGGDPDVLDQHNRTALLVAAEHGHVKVIDVLKKHEAHLDHLDTNGQTAMHIAAIANQSDALLKLKALGARTDIEDAQGRIPLYAAAVHNCAEAVKTILGFSPTLDIDSVGQALIQAAIAGGNDRAITEILNIARTKGVLKSLIRATVHSASKNSTLGEVFKAFESNLSGKTHWASDVWFDAVASARIETLDALLDNGFAIETKNSDHDTALAMAAKLGQVSVIEKLIERGANIYFDKNGKNVLYMAAEMLQPEAMEAILSAMVAKGDKTKSETLLQDLIRKAARKVEWKALESVFAMSETSGAETAIKKVIRPDQTKPIETTHELDVLVIHEVAKGLGKTFMDNLKEVRNANIWYQETSGASLAWFSRVRLGYTPSTAMKNRLLGH